MYVDQSTLCILPFIFLNFIIFPFLGMAEENERKLIVVLEGAFLESIKVGPKKYELLNPDKHGSIIRKKKRDVQNIRPDIVHQCLLFLMDSPLNRAGCLRVYIHTQQNCLIQIDPSTRIPRTFDRFCGLMVDLLHNLKIKGQTKTGSSKTLLRIIANPVQKHFPSGTVALTASAIGERVEPEELAMSGKTHAVVIGAIAHGHVDVDYTEKTVSFSSANLSAATACAKLLIGYEKAWKID